MIYDGPTFNLINKLPNGIRVVIFAAPPSQIPIEEVGGIAWQVLECQSGQTLPVTIYDIEKSVEIRVDNLNWTSSMPIMSGSSYTLMGSINTEIMFVPGGGNAPSNCIQVNNEATVGPATLTISYGGQPFSTGGVWSGSSVQLSIADNIAIGIDNSNVVEQGQNFWAMMLQGNIGTFELDGIQSADITITAGTGTNRYTYTLSNVVKA